MSPLSIRTSRKQLLNQVRSFWCPEWHSCSSESMSSFGGYSVGWGPTSRDFFRRAERTKPLRFLPVRAFVPPHRQVSDRDDVIFPRCPSDVGWSSATSSVASRLQEALQPVRPTQAHRLLRPRAQSRRWQTLCLPSKTI